MSQPTITLDVHNLHNLETKDGGFTRATLNALGVSWPPSTNWLRNLVGMTILESQYLEAWNGRLIFAPISRKKKRRKKRKINKT